MTQEEYRAKKLEAFKKVFFYHDTGLTELQAFLSQTIDELWVDIQTFEAQTILTKEQIERGKASILDYTFKNLYSKIALEMVKEGAIVYDRKKNDLGEVIIAKCSACIAEAERMRDLSIKGK